MNEGYSFIEGERVRLWDGKMYPRARVEQEMAGLSDYANEHDTLTETAPLRLWNTIVGSVLWDISIGVVFGALVFLWSANLIISIVMATFIAIVFALLQGAPLVWLAQRARRTVSVNNGYVNFSLRRRTVSLPLDSFQWYRGRARHDWMYKVGGYPNVQTVVLVTRVKFRWIPATSHKIACGVTPEMRSRWEAFLTLAGVPYGRRGLKVNLATSRQNQPGQDDSEVTCDDSKTGS